MPNFLIVGAQKAGTTALYQHLKKHPDVFMSPVKEPHFFAFEGEDLDFRGPRDRETLGHMVVGDEGAYRELFAGANGERARGEASAMYLYMEEAVGGIRRHVPDAKLVAVLRNPADRAFSSFLHMVRDGREPIPDFGRALAAEEGRIGGRWSPIWHYRRMGFYHEQLSRYYEAFGPERLRVYLYEDLEGSPERVLRDIHEFIGVDPSFVPDVSARYNVSGVPKSRRLHALHRFLLRPNPVKSALKPFFPKGLRRRMVEGSLNALRNRNLVKPPFPDEVRRGLIEGYREDISKLETLLDRDLSGWLR
ncbi:sulfotransferase [Rubrobacter marinus]|uniref:Sulfotransferase n=2 Tax=Rubrobacter marinus TaxID=2653852 RepID=A0A6G8Q341_9ACTN|nr:sulfotransferase [Rubrobacter marinus]